MNVLQEYTLEYIKKNKRSSIASMIAIFIASVLLTSVCIYKDTEGAYSKYVYKELGGNWHGELFEDTQGKYLDTVKAYANVEEVMVKGQWYAGYLGKDEKRPYMIIRDADAAYWRDMPEKRSLIEGRVPERVGEIVVSKQLTKRYPEIEVGKPLKIQIGDRMVDGSVLEPRTSLEVDETFRVKEELTYTVVGIMDIATSSVSPGYIAMGYLEHQQILADDYLTIYLRMRNPRTIYKDLPAIAQQVGYEKDEYGEYNVKYNMQLLAQDLIFPPEVYVNPSSQALVKGIFFAFIGGLLIGLFVFIIHNSFALSVQGRIKQLGMFKSIGATPKQITQSVTFEAFVLASIPVPLGIAVAYALNKIFFSYVNTLNKEITNNSLGESYIPIEMVCRASTLILAIIMITLTVWLSAYLPTRKKSKYFPIQLIKNPGENKNFSSKKNKRWYRKNSKKREMSIYKELVKNSFNMNKKTFRIAIITLTLSLTLVGGYVLILDTAELVSYINYSAYTDQSISLYIQDGREPEEEIVKLIRTHPLVENSIFTSTLEGTAEIRANQASDEMEAIGGFKRIANTNRYTLIQQGEGYRINARILALDDESFNHYCEMLGISPDPFYSQDTYQTILYNQTKDTFKSRGRQEVLIPFLDIQVGDVLEVTKKNWNSATGGTEKITTCIGAVVDQLPAKPIRNPNNYATLQIVPMSTYYEMSKALGQREISTTMRTTAYIYTEDKDTLEVVEDITEGCEMWYGQGDYEIWDKYHDELSREEANKLSAAMMYCIAGLFAFIGVSNAFTSIYGSLRQRRREFAMLRSIGIEQQGIQKLLVREAIYFGILPIVFSVPIVVGIQSILLYIQGVSWLEIIRYINIWPIIICIGATVGAILLAYRIGSKKIREDKIVEAIKDQTV